MKKYGVTKKWANKMLEEYKLTDEYMQMDQELKDFIVYGKPTTWFDDELLKEIK